MLDPNSFAKMIIELLSLAGPGLKSWGILAWFRMDMTIFSVFEEMSEGNWRVGLRIPGSDKGELVALGR